MILQKRIAFLHHLNQAGGVRVLREMLAYDTAGDIMRRRHVAELQFAAVPYHAVAVAHTWMKFKFRIAEMRLHSLDDLGGLFTRNIARAVIHHRFIRVVRLVRQRDEIAAESNICIAKLHAHADGLERGAAGVVFFRVVTHHAEVGNIAARGQAFGDRAHEADFTALGEGVEQRLFRQHHRRLTAEGWDGIVRHAIVKDNCIFHQESSPFSTNKICYLKYATPEANIF